MLRRTIGLVRPAIAVLAVLAALGGCGYRPLRGALEGRPRIVVAHARVHVPSGAGVALATEAEAGARAELARWGALASGDEAEVDRLTIEIVRVDERSEGAAVITGPTGDGALARGVRLRMTLRGDVEGHGATFATPDVDVTEAIAADAGDALGWDAARAAAARGAARRGGARVARDVLGVP